MIIKREVLNICYLVIMLSPDMKITWGHYKIYSPNNIELSKDRLSRNK